MKKLTFAIAAVGALLLAVPGARAGIEFTGSSGSLSAGVVFGLSGGNLTVTLTNTSLADVLAPADVLTAVFFNINGGTLTPLSAVVAPGSIRLFPPGDPGLDVGGEWAYKAGLSGAPGGATQGISSSGLGLFSPGNRFPGANLQGPESVDGVQYGITSAGDIPTSGNDKVTGSQSLIKNSVFFTLSGSGLPTSESSLFISNVSFQYGTCLTEPNVRVPEPVMLATLMLGLLGVGAFWRKRSGDPV